MDSLLKLITDYRLSDIIILVGLLCTSAVGIANIYKKIVSVLELYRAKKNSEDDRKKEIDDKFTKLNDKVKELQEEIDTNTADLTNKISNLEKKYNDLSSQQNNIKTDLNKYNKTTAKNALYKLANELIAKQWASQSEYDELHDLNEVYMKSGDTKFVIPPIIQRALNIPILTDEEIKERTIKLPNGGGLR